MVVEIVVRPGCSLTCCLLLGVWVGVLATITARLLLSQGGFWFLALLCFVLFNDCVQPCFKPKTIQPNIIIDLDSRFASDRRNLHKVIRGLHRLPKIFNPKPPQSLNLIDKADLIPNKCGLTSPHKPGSLFLHLRYLFTSANNKACFRE